VPFSSFQRAKLFWILPPPIFSLKPERFGLPLRHPALSFRDRQTQLPFGMIAMTSRSRRRGGVQKIAPS
jgi:hypothetical protein